MDWSLHRGAEFRKPVCELEKAQQYSFTGIHSFEMKKPHFQSLGAQATFIGVQLLTAYYANQMMETAVRHTIYW